MTIFYVGLERYKERYTEMLARWSVERFRRRGFDVVEVLPQKHDDSLGLIEVGKVLDAHGRCRFAAAQMSSLAEHLRGATSLDVVYFEDAFTPGFEAVPYILDQRPSFNRPLVYARNHAQSMDADDFTFPMRGWMRHYEFLVDNVVSRWFVACEEHRELMRVSMLSAEISVVGLPFDNNDVASIAGGSALAPHARPLKIVYASRLDSEKQPRFLARVAAEIKSRRQDIEIVVCMGSNDIRSDDEVGVRLLKELEAAGTISIKRGLSKKDYYKELKGARVLLNTAKQDWISNTAIEASALGAMLVAPAYKSFPALVGNSRRQLYVPWSVDDAATVAIDAVDDPQPFEETKKIALDQDKTLDRICDLIEVDLARHNDKKA